MDSARRRVLRYQRQRDVRKLKASSFIGRSANNKRELELMQLQSILPQVL